MRPYVYAILAGVFLLAGCHLLTKPQQSSEITGRTPFIYSSDLYQPPQDPDDHYDLAMLSCLNELEIKALVFDNATSSRKADEIGLSALQQMAKITGNITPHWQTGLPNPLLSPDDQALDQPAAFQGGVELILSTLEQSEEQVVMFLVGSCRDFTVAFNRNPDLLKRKVKAVYVNAGNGPKGRQDEWNVTLDPHAYVGLMMSGLPIYWCPCFTDKFQLSTPDEVAAGKAFCTYFIVPNQAAMLSSTRSVVKNYFAYALNRSNEEPLNFLDKEVQPLPEKPRNMWCTGPFLHAAGRQIFRTQDGRWVACTPEKAKTMGITTPPVEVFHFEPVHVKYTMTDVKGKLLPEFQEDNNTTSGAHIQVFRYTHPDFNAIMTSVLADILESL